MPPRAVTGVVPRSLGHGLLHAVRRVLPLGAATTPASTAVSWIVGRISGDAFCWLRAAASQSPARSFSARALDGIGRSGPREDVEHHAVPCASSGSIVVSLYNVRQHPTTVPLLLYLPPGPQPPWDGDGTGADGAGEDGQRTARWFEPVLEPPPRFLLRQNFPIAAIRYRWCPGATAGGKEASPDRGPPAWSSSDLWPRPLHDVLFAYDWVKKHLSPPLSASTRSRDGRRHLLRRDLYVYGSYLGAGLATSLALTETHPQHRVAVRGVAAYNGIYNWTAYVGMTPESIPVADDAETVHDVTPGIQALPLLFRKPPDLFDAFASPCLFFRTTGHLLAPLDLDRDVSRRLLEESEARLGEEVGEKDGPNTDRVFGMRTYGAELLGMSRKVYLGFPPLQSTLCIPSSLFLHTADPPPPVPEKPARARRQNTKPRTRKIPESANGNNSFAMQADEMTSLMRRGIDKVEAKRRRTVKSTLLPEYSDHRIDESHAATQSSESERRVRMVGVAPPTDDRLGLGEDGQKILLDWLDEQMLNTSM